MTDAAKRLPCRADHCEDGRILVDDTRSSDWEPHEYATDCKTCDGTGYLDFWECGSCGLSRTCTDEMPWYTSKDGWYNCRACVREQALDGVDFAAMAVGLREAHAVIDSISRCGYALSRALLVGRAMGIVGFYADKLEGLAKALGRES